MTGSEAWKFVFLIVMIAGLAWIVLHKPASVQDQVRPKPSPRPLKPRTLEDCPLCRAAHAEPPQRRTLPQPYRQTKSPRGSKKRILTAGYACPNPHCLYFGITDDQIHALVGYGYHGRQQRIQDLRCQACRTKFSVRSGTVLHRLKTPPHRVAEVLGALAEGVSLGAAVRVFGHSEFTLRTWLTRAGLHGASLHVRFFRNLKLPHVQLDEIRTKTRQSAEPLWVWIALDAPTKLIPVLKVGPRTQSMAHAVMHALVKTLARNHLPTFTSDGLKFYFYALTAHFGDWVTPVGERTRHWQLRANLLYGQLIKRYCRHRLVRVERRALLGSWLPLSAALRAAGPSATIQTAFIERLNLTVRQAVAALTRRTWGLAQSPAELVLHLEWWRAYYHFARPHTSLSSQPADRSPRSKRRRCTPAQAAGLTDHLWTITELLAFPLSKTAS